MREKIDAADILVNGTLLGMKPKEDTTVISDTTMFHEGLVVADVVYNPERDKILKRSKKKHGCITVPGKRNAIMAGELHLSNYLQGKICRFDEVKRKDSSREYKIHRSYMETKKIRNCNKQISGLFFSYAISFP